VRAAELSVTARLARVYVLLPVHNRRATTERTVRCLCAQRYRHFHLVLIDDGSTDGTAEMVRGHLADTTVIRGTGQWWWGGSLEQGLRWLRTSGAAPDDLVLMINDDTEFDESFLEGAVHFMQNRRRTLLLARLMDPKSGACLDSGVCADWRAPSFAVAESAAQVNCFSTRGLFIHVRDVFEIGGFHPFLLPHYASDYEFTMRAHRKGFALLTSPAVWLVEDSSMTGQRAPTTESLAQFLGVAFSKRYLSNPIYWSTFVVLACRPWKHVPRCLWWVWRGFLKNLVTAARNSVHAVFS
jgi:GT2 family glycosyltransferase